MSNDFWRTKKQSEQFKCGSTITERVKAYIETWEERCYFNGIPDELPDKLLKSGRAPSYKALALAILNNRFYNIGFIGKRSDWYDVLKEKKKSNQLELF